MIAGEPIKAGQFMGINSAGEIVPMQPPSIFHVEARLTWAGKVWRALGDALMALHLNRLAGLCWLQEAKHTYFVPL